MAKKVTKSVKPASKSVKLSDVGKVIASYFRGLNKAVYVGVLAVLSIFLFFSPWLNVTVLSNISKILQLPMVSGIFSIPQLILTSLFSIDHLITNVVNFFDTINLSRFDGESLAKLSQILTTIGTLAGAELGSKASNMNDLVGAVQSLLPDGAMLEYYKSILLSVGGAIKGASAGVMVVILTVVGFNIYTAIITFWKKRITKGCIAAFIIEGVFVLIFMIGCFVTNTIVHSYVFFLKDVIAPTGWAWLTLIVCVAGLVLSAKYYKRKPKAAKKTTKKATKKK